MESWTRLRDGPGPRVRGGGIVQASAAASQEAAMRSGPGTLAAGWQGGFCAENRTKLFFFL